MSTRVTRRAADPMGPAATVSDPIPLWLNVIAVALPPIHVATRRT